jgi:hypothetical protein
VEWLLHNIPDLGSYIPLGISIELHAKFQHAKEMDKQQKKYAWVDGNGTQMCITSKDVDECFDDYYNETYGK